MFAPTPPLESVRTIISLAATDVPGEPKHDRRPDSEERTQILLVDISRAYFNAKTNDDDPVYVELRPSVCRAPARALVSPWYMGPFAQAHVWHEARCH